MRGLERKHGYTLVEILIVVSTLGLLSVVAIPSYISSRASILANEVADNYRTYAMAFKSYAAEHGSWPAKAGIGVPPPGMEGRLPRFDSESPIGGTWDWECGQPDLKAGISLVNCKPNPAVLKRIDRMLDDGNLATGQIYVRDNRLTLVLER
ncbi:MAG: type II secretion system protein [Oceanipulchritudo sp.]